MFAHAMGPNVFRGTAGAAEGGGGSGGCKCKRGRGSRKKALEESGGHMSPLLLSAQSCRRFVFNINAEAGNKPCPNTGVGWWTGEDRPQASHQQLPPFPSSFGPVSLSLHFTSCKYEWVHGLMARASNIDARAHLDTDSPGTL